MKAKIYSLICGIMVFLGTGCTNFLDLEPVDSANGEQIWGTALGTRQLTAGGYAEFRRCLLYKNPFYAYGDLPSQCVFQAKEWNWSPITKDGNFGNSHLAYLDYLTNWSAFYKVITIANTIVYHIEDLDPSEFNKDVEEGLKEKNQLSGEANFLYAYSYFWLVRIWEKVPLVKDPIETADQAIEDGSTIGRPQSEPLEVLEYCLLRLNDAIVNLEYKSPGDEGYGVRADKAAALALKAHICAWMASLEEDSQKKKELYLIADDALNALMVNGNRSLVDYSNASDLSEMFEGCSSEALFELNVSIADNESFYINNGYVPIHGKVSWQESFKQGTGHLIVADMDQTSLLYNERDLRRTIFFNDLGNKNDDAKFPPVLVKYMEGIAEDPIETSKIYAESNVPLLRLTDAHLLKAEIQCLLGNYGEARILLNEIRNRSKIGDFPRGDDELLVAIFDERARELVGEGHSAFDRIRLNHWEGCSWYTSERLSRKGQYWPIDLPSLRPSNRELKQTPFWQGAF